MLHLASCQLTLRRKEAKKLGVKKNKLYHLTGLLSKSFSNSKFPPD